MRSPSPGLPAQRQIDPQVAAVVASLRQRLQAIYGDRLLELVLYGSQARGDATLGSDIDLLVVLRGPVDPLAEIGRTEEAIAALSLDVGTVISCVFVSEEQAETEQSPLLLNVRREGVRV